MWNVIGKIFGSGKVIEKGLELIDDIQTSTEEEIRAKTMFTFTFLACFTITLGMTLAGQGDVEGVKAVLGDFYIGEIMLVIITFYFGGGVIDSIKRK